MPPFGDLHGNSHEPCTTNVGAVRVRGVALQARVLARRRREQVAEEVALVAEDRGRQARAVGGAAEVAVLGRLGHVADSRVPRVADARGDDDLGGVAAAARGAAGQGFEFFFRRRKVSFFFRRGGSERRSSKSIPLPLLFFPLLCPFFSKGKNPKKKKSSKKKSTLLTIRVLEHAAVHALQHRGAARRRGHRRDCALGERRGPLPRERQREEGGRRRGKRERRRRRARTSASETRKKSVPWFL